MRRVAIIIDEAHSSQGSDIRCREHVLSEVGAEEGDETFEEQGQPHHGGGKAPSERDLLRLHGHAEEQDVVCQSQCPDQPPARLRARRGDPALEPLARPAFGHRVMSASVRLLQLHFPASYDKAA